MTSDLLRRVEYLESIADVPAYRIAKLQMQPGDILMVQTNKKLSPEMCERLIANVHACVPPGTKVLVLDGDEWQIRVVRPA